MFHELIRSEDYLERLRRDVVHVIERLAWMQLDETPGAYFRLREEAAQIRAELEQTQTLLNAMYASTSWRLTSPLRALGIWARRIVR